MIIGYLLASLVCVIVLAYLHSSHRRQIKVSRGSAFDDCLGKLSSFRLLQDDVDYPILQGQYRGLNVELALIADHVGYRKVPSLWLTVTIQAPIACEVILDYLVRPQNIEFYSPSADLDHELPLPPHWPPYAQLRTDAPDNVPPLRLLDPTVALFANESMKELLITPKGTRLVCQIDQARRRDYLILRAVGFDHDRVDARLVYPLLDELLALRDRLSDWHTSSDARITGEGTDFAPFVTGADPESDLRSDAIFATT